MNEPFSLLTSHPHIFVFTNAIRPVHTEPYVTMKHLPDSTVFPYPILGGPNLLPFHKGTNLQSPEKLRDLQPLLNICNSDRQLKDCKMAGKYIRMGDLRNPHKTDPQTPYGKPWR